MDMDIVRSTSKYAKLKAVRKEPNPKDGVSDMEEDGVAKQPIVLNQCIAMVFARPMGLEAATGAEKSRSSRKPLYCTWPSRHR